MGQDIAAGETVTALIGLEQFQVIEPDAGDLGHLVAVTCKLFNCIDQGSTVSIFAERGHGRIGIPFVQVHKAVAGHAALPLDCGTVDAAEDGIEGIFVGFHILARRKVLAGGGFGIVILILTDGGFHSISAAVCHLQHDLHIAGNGSRNGRSVFFGQLGGDLRRSGIRALGQRGTEPVHRQIAGGGIARCVGNDKAAAAVLRDRHRQGPQLVAILFQLSGNVRAIHRDRHQSAQIGKVRSQIYGLTLPDGRRLGKGAAPVDTGCGGIGLDIQRLGEGLLQPVKSNLAALCFDGDGVRNGFAVAEADCHGSFAVCGGIGFRAKTGKIAAHLDLHGRHGIRSHEIQVDGIRQSLEGEGITFIGHCQVASQRRSLQVIGPHKGFHEVPCVMAGVPGVAGGVVPGEDAVVIVDVQGHALALHLVADVVEGVGRRIGHADLALTSLGGHDHHGSLVHIVVENAEVPGAIVCELGDGDRGCCFRAGLHGQRQTQGGTDLHIDAADRGKEGLRLHAVELHVVGGVVFDVFIVAGVIALNGHP